METLPSLLGNSGTRYYTIDNFSQAEVKIDRKHNCVVNGHYVYMDNDCVILKECNERYTKKMVVDIDHEMPPERIDDSILVLLTKNTVTLVCTNTFKVLQKVTCQYSKYFTGCNYIVLLCGSELVAINRTYVRTYKIPYKFDKIKLGVDAFALKLKTEFDSKITVYDYYGNELMSQRFRNQVISFECTSHCLVVKRDIRDIEIIYTNYSKQRLKFTTIHVELTPYFLILRNNIWYRIISHKVEYMRSYSIIDRYSCIMNDYLCNDRKLYNLRTFNTTKIINATTDKPVECTFWVAIPKGAPSIDKIIDMVDFLPKPIANIIANYL